MGSRLIGFGHDPSRDAEEPGIGGDALPSTGSIGPIHLMSRTFFDVKMERRLRFTNEHGFGDGWQHEILLERILEPEPKVAFPRCLEGDEGEEITRP